VLQDRLFSTYTVLWRKRDHHRRLNQWLSSFLVSRENLDRNDAEEVQTLGSVLKAVLHYIHHAMEIPEVLRTFLPKHLQGWNGIDNRDVILDIMVYLPLQSFHGSYKISG
jgi:centromere protein I